MVQGLKQKQRRLEVEMPKAVQNHLDLVGQAAQLKR
jgi:hypothetical protein